MFAGSAVLIFETPPKRALVSDCHAANSSSEDMFNTDCSLGSMPNSAWWCLGVVTGADDGLAGEADKTAKASQCSSTRPLEGHRDRRRHRP